MEAEVPTARPFKYVKPDRDRRKTLVKLAQTDRLFSSVHVIKEGGENNLHSHEFLDGFWFVLEGEATFYGEGDVVIAKAKKHEGVLLPRNFPYWFESSGDVDLELLQVEAFAIPLPDDEAMLADRIDYQPKKREIGSIEVIDAREGLSPSEN